MKSGLDFFPLDVSFEDKVKLIEAEFGLQGFAVVVKLWQKVYSVGYYCEWTSDVALLFSQEIRLGCNVVSEIVAASIRRGIFDSELYEKYGILTSAGIQKRYFEACSRRKEVKVKKQYLLVKCDQILKNVNIIEENVNISYENVYTNQQSKVKESKVKESNRSINASCAEATKGCSEPVVISLPLIDGTDYGIAQSYFTTLCNLYPAVDVMQELRNMSDRIAESGLPRRSARR